MDKFLFKATYKLAGIDFDYEELQLIAAVNEAEAKVKLKNYILSTDGKHNEIIDFEIEDLNLS